MNEGSSRKQGSERALVSMFLLVFGNGAASCSFVLFRFVDQNGYDFAAHIVALEHEATNRALQVNFGPTVR